MQNFSSVDTNSNRGFHLSAEKVFSVFSFFSVFSVLKFFPNCFNTEDTEKTEGTENSPQTRANSLRQPLMFLAS